MHPPRPPLYPPVRLDLPLIPPLSPFYIPPPPPPQFIPSVTRHLVTPPPPHGPTRQGMPTSPSPVPPPIWGQTPQIRGRDVVAVATAGYPWMRGAPPQLQSHSPGETTAAGGGLRGHFTHFPTGPSPRAPHSGAAARPGGTPCHPRVGSPRGRVPWKREAVTCFNSPSRARLVPPGPAASLSHPGPGPRMRRGVPRRGLERGGGCGGGEWGPGVLLGPARGGS